MNELLTAIASASLIRRTGLITRMVGLTIQADGPDVAIGDLCLLHPKTAARPTKAEVVGITREGITLMPFGSSSGLSAGCIVEATAHRSTIGVGDALLGRVINGFGEPIDRLGPLGSRGALESVPLANKAPAALERPRIKEILETGVKAIDALLTLGRGQRVGIFAGSGVGKSSLLGMVCKGTSADLNVIALIGERGREVKDFIEEQLGPEGLARSVVVVATSDEPALTRLRATYAAVSIAEYFRSQGKQVLLTMDSVTRFAMARREIGLAAGEPPTARGYTPSVFAEIPELCERCGTSESGGSISALFTVLVEGDDFNEPITDALRATLDGHIVLTRSLAQQGHFPSIDVLASVSRLAKDLCSEKEKQIAATAFEDLAVYEKNRQLVDIGAYQQGTNPTIDRALENAPKLTAWLRQPLNEKHSRADALQQLGRIITANGVLQK